jgi:hypothetical protein
MKRVNVIWLRVASACLVAMFFVECLTVDINGCVLALNELATTILVDGNVVCGVVIALILLRGDVNWRLLHFGTLLFYAVMFLPVLIQFVP